LLLWVRETAVIELLRSCKQENINSAKESVENICLKPSRRPDLVVWNFHNNNKPTLVDFITISALSTDVLHRSWNYATTGSVAAKRAPYIYAYDTTECDSGPITMEVGGRAGNEFAKFIKQVASHTGTHLNNADENLESTLLLSGNA